MRRGSRDTGLKRMCMLIFVMFGSALSHTCHCHSGSELISDPEYEVNNKNAYSESLYLIFSYHHGLFQHQVRRFYHDHTVK